MRKLLVAGNWKMHGNRQSITELLSDFQGQATEAVDIAVFPSAPYLQLVSEQLSGTGVGFGAQNVSEHQQGAYTGEVAAGMLVDFGCRYVLVGHSERRSLYAETSEQVAEKYSAAQVAGILPVLCVGETLEQRDKGNTFSVIVEQLDAVIQEVGLPGLARGVIAYEPVWAIGTGVTASPEQAQAVHKSIREKLGQYGDETRIVYGGSVKSSNALELFSQPDIDGGLVGGASLKAEEFIAICKAAEAVIK